MSATPEQIAERLDGATVRADELPDTRPVYTTETVTLYVVPLGLTLADLRAAAALIRAQAERVRVLEGALRGLLRTHDDPADPESAVAMEREIRLVEQARAALKAAP